LQYCTIFKAQISLTGSSVLCPSIGNQMNTGIHSNKELVMQKIKFEIKITALYALAGGMWIIFSDKLLYYFIKDTDLLTTIQTYKGWFYVIVTALLLYSLLRNHLASMRIAKQKAIENDKLKTVFLQNISHEIRTPMNGIVGFSGLLQNEDLSEEQKKQYLEIITKSSNQLLKVVNDVLDISLIETRNISSSISELHLNNFMEELYFSFEPLILKDISFSLKKGLSDVSSMVLTDAIKIRQILNNLLNNAIKFTEKGHIRFGYVLKNNELEFFIEDTGIGIASHAHDKIFEHFHKADTEISRLYEGVGLGLAICKGDLELLHGRIWVKSELNKGSTFFFTLPYNPVNQTETA
jgi:signal transduction histidine kinase